MDRPAGRTLENGIELPQPWPPRPEAVTSEPMSPPYLQAPPAVIPIDRGRQLFVDDFLVQSATMRRVWHSAEYHPDGPVIVPDRPWEHEGGHPTAMVFSDGVWWDPREERYRAWYLGGYCAATCHATSDDGIHWEKPEYDVVPGTNIVQPDARDSSVVWLDHDDPDPGTRFKLYNVVLEGRWTIRSHASADGIHWSAPVRQRRLPGDRTTVYYNPFRGMWTASLRAGTDLGRIRAIYEAPTWTEVLEWPEGAPSWWVGADRLDAARPDLQTRPELYNLDVVAYESLLIGLFSIWYGHPSDRPKPNDLMLGFSRDGYHWHRPCRVPFMPVSEDRRDWNWGNIQSAGGGCIVAGNRLRFYCSGRTSPAETPGTHTCVTGLATLRRDGFASMEAGSGGAELLTRPVRFTGSRLFVNADACGGELRVEAVDGAGRPIPGYAAADCRPITADDVTQPVAWAGGPDLAPLAGTPVQLRFVGRDARLFAFWVSPDDRGASHGYVAAGGRGFHGATDTVGVAVR